MRIFITGGAGLLGSNLAKALGTKHEVDAAGHSRPVQNRGRGLALDITNPADIARALDGHGYDVLIHSAAIRSPEECAKDVERAYLVNVLAVEHLAAACRRNKIKLVYIATDYVFPGANPPYREDSLPDPINLYGRTKLAGEYAARSVPGHLSVRVPIMWSDEPEHSLVSQGDFLEKLRRGERFGVEGVLVRHYSHAADIAAAIAFCVDRDVKGILNLSAGEAQTKAEYARTVAKMHGLDPTLVENAGIPGNTAERPQDPTLDTSRYQSLGGPRIRGLSEVAAAIIRKRG